MSKIFIRFQPVFEEPMLSGVKVCTARTKRMGELGDTFEAFGAMFELVSVEDVSLYEANTFWKEEGCKSREQFISIWNGLHPRVGYTDSQRVYLHLFKKVSL